MNNLAGGFAGVRDTIIKAIHDFFNPNLDGYTNFDFGSGTMINLKIIIFGIFAGVLLASVYTIYTRTTLGAIVRKILESENFGKESAKTLEELGYAKHYPIRYALRHGYTLRRVIHCVEEEEFMTANPKGRFKGNFDDCHFYIEEKDKYTAGMRFRSNGSGYGTFFFVLLVSVLCILIIFGILPEILAFLDNVISQYSVKGNTVMP